MLRQTAYARGYRVRVKKTEATLIAAVTLFNMYSLAISCAQRNSLYILSSLASVALVFAPYLCERLLSVRISTDLKFTYILLAMCGPVLGNVYKFYYIVPYWDKALHMLSGFSFAALGYCLPDLCDRRHGEHSAFMKSVFAFCFSLAVAALWEFYEYGADMLLGLDMQNDTIINSISSYMLGAETGTIGGMSDIASVTVNGAALPYAGYLDIGLIDTMNDMLICAAGTMAFLCLSYIKRGSNSFASITVVKRD